MKPISQTPKAITQTSFFNPNKSKTDAFFKDTKVNSCSYVLVKNGQSLAFPFIIRNERGRGLNHYKTVPEKSKEVKTVYMHDYSPYPNMHCGMGKKPLMPYDPSSYRSRLPVGGIVMSHKNKSLIELGANGLINSKQWNSTYRDNFRWPRLVPISNPGILSDMAKSSHQKLEAIN